MDFGADHGTAHAPLSTTLTLTLLGDGPALNPFVIRLPKNHRVLRLPGTKCCLRHSASA